MSRAKSSESLVTVEKGKWAWHEGRQELSFERERGTRSSRRRGGKPRTPASGTAQPYLVMPKKRDDLTADRTVNLEDVKAVAVGMISTELVQKMHKRTSVLFDECYRTEQMNAFLWATLLYFDAYLKHDRAQNDSNLTIPGTLGDGAREKLKMSVEAMEQSKVNLGEAYSFLIMGMGNKEAHHSMQGELRASRSHTDADLYEAVYEFVLYVTWIAFGYDHWLTIHKELGSFFRMPQFNRELKGREDGRTAPEVDLEGLGVTNTSDSEYLSYRIYYDRPPVGSLNQLHSPVLCNYLPSPRQKHPWLFEPPYKPDRSDRKPVLPVTLCYPEKLGIIGESISKFDPATLRQLETLSESEGSESCSEDENVTDDDT